MKSKIIISLSLFFLSIFTTATAQQVAVIDQGRNTTLTNQGTFISPWCYNSAGKSWKPYKFNFAGPTQDLSQMTTLALEGGIGNSRGVSLCSNGFSYEDHLNNTPISTVAGTTPTTAVADVPKTKRLPNLAPQSIAMITRNNNRHFLNRPYASQQFGANLF